MRNLTGGDLFENDPLDDAFAEFSEADGAPDAANTIRRIQEEAKSLSAEEISALAERAERHAQMALEFVETLSPEDAPNADDAETLRGMAIMIVRAANMLGPVTFASYLRDVISAAYALGARRASTRSDSPFNE